MYKATMFPMFRTRGSSEILKRLHGIVCASIPRIVSATFNWVYLQYNGREIKIVLFLSFLLRLSLHGGEDYRLLLMDKIIIEVNDVSGCIAETCKESAI